MHFFAARSRTAPPSLLSCLSITVEPVHATGSVHSTVPPLKSFFGLPPQALSVPKIEFRPPQGSPKEVDRQAASARARRRRRRRSVQARPLRASQTPHQYGNSLPMVPMHIFQKPCPAPFLHRKPLPSSAATSAPLQPRPSRSIIRCGKAGAARGLPFASLCPPPL